MGVGGLEGWGGVGWGVAGTLSHDVHSLRQSLSEVGPEVVYMRPRLYIYNLCMQSANGHVCREWEETEAYSIYIVS